MGVLVTLADESCPECHGEPELVYVKPRALRKRCTECGHAWSESRELPLFEGGWVTDVGVELFEVP
jgi:hypothetical protein